MAFADLAWNGRAADPDPALQLATGVRPLNGGATIRLATGARFVGRLAIPMLAGRVQSSISGPGEACVVFEPAAGFDAGVGCICVVVLTDKHVERSPVDAQVWLTTPGVNDVPARMSCQPIEFQVRLKT